MKRIISLLLAIVMAFGLVACGSKPIDTTAPAETTAPVETTASIIELPQPPHKSKSIVCRNGTIYTASQYWDFYTSNFYFNSIPQYEDIHFFSFDYNEWVEDHPDATYVEEDSWTLSISGDTLVQVDLYGYDYDQEDEMIGAYVNANWLDRINDAEENLSEVVVPEYINDNIVTLIVLTMRDANTGEYYYEYLGRADIGA